MPLVLMYCGLTKGKFLSHNSQMKLPWPAMLVIRFGFRTRDRIIPIPETAVLRRLNLACHLLLGKAHG